MHCVANWVTCTRVNARRLHRVVSVATLAIGLYKAAFTPGLRWGQHKLIQCVTAESSVSLVKVDRCHCAVVYSPIYRYIDCMLSHESRQIFVHVYLDGIDDRSSKF